MAKELSNDLSESRGALSPGSVSLWLRVHGKAAQGSRAFLNGMTGSTGWPYFFPYCLLVKTPPTLFFLAILSAVWLVRTWLGAGDWRLRRQAIGESLFRTAPLWVLFFVYWAFAIASHLNIGHRHILPTYPVLLVFAGGAWFWVARRESDSATQEAENAATMGEYSRDSAPGWQLGVGRRSPGWCSSASARFAGESIFSWPNYVSYFNQIVGKRHAYRHLVDSSLDWGQDLPALKKWLFDVGLDASTESPTYLSYFGTGSPAYYGITANRLPCFIQWDPPQIPEPLRQGLTASVRPCCKAFTQISPVIGRRSTRPFTESYCGP